MQKIDVDFLDMCKGLVLGPIIVPEKLPATEFRRLCNQFGAKMFVIKNEIDRMKRERGGTILYVHNSIPTYIVSIYPGQSSLSF